VKGCDPLRYDEAIHIWQLDIEDDHIGPQPHRLRDSTGPIRGLADDFEALRLEQRSGRTPELLVVIHDEQSEWHAFIITNERWERIVVSTKGTEGGVPPAGFGQHLRHTCAAPLISRGAQVKAVQHHLGRSSATVTLI